MDAGFPPISQEAAEKLISVAEGEPQALKRGWF
jgi:hypothetical protein